MADDEEPSGAQKMLGDFAPALVGYTDDVLFGQVWERPELSPRDRSLVTVAALTAPTSPSTPAGRRRCPRWSWRGRSSAATDPAPAPVPHGHRARAAER
jgi:hypothetical protein